MNTSQEQLPLLPNPPALWHPLAPNGPCKSFLSPQLTGSNQLIDSYATPSVTACKCTPPGSLFNINTATEDSFVEYP